MPIPYDNFGTYWVIKPYVDTSPYLVIATIAAITGIVMAYFEMKRRKIGKELRHTILSSISIYIFLVVFARLFYFLGPWSWQEYPSFASRILNIASFNAGMVFYGGLIGGIFGVYVYSKIKHAKTKNKKDLGFWKLIDAWIVPLGIFLFIARIGCYTAGCCYGIASTLNLPWLIQRGSSVIHPTQIYSSFFGLVLFTAMTELKYRQKIKRMFDGYVLLWGVIIYSTGRFLIEFLRYYHTRFFGLSMSQVISILLFLICSILLIFKYKKHKNKV